VLLQNRSALNPVREVFAVPVSRVLDEQQETLDLSKIAHFQSLGGAKTVHELGRCLCLAIRVDLEDDRAAPFGHRVDADGDFEAGELTVPLSATFTRDAQHAIQLTIRDRAGNLSKPALSVFSIVADGEPPRVDILSPSQKSLFSARESVTLLAVLYDLGRSGLDRSSVVLKLDGKEIPADDPATAEDEGYLLVKGLLRWEFGDLTPGKHVISIGVKDQAGNVAQDALWPFEVK